MFEFDINKDKNLKVHFIGIGGISMSGLAETLLHYGYKVSGSDAHDSKIIDKLVKKGAHISIGHDAANIEGADLVVYTAAVKWDNPELIGANQRNIPIIDRAEFLGQLMKQYEYSIAVSGTHGKTTTTSLIAIMLNNAKLDPTIMVGGEVDAIGGNVRPGKSPYFIAEACEYVESFLKLYPYIGIILNIDADHLDYYRDIEHITQSFQKFADLINKEGYLIACADDTHINTIIPNTKCSVITYGLESEADWMARNIFYDDRGCGEYDAFYKNEFFGRFKLSIPGRHNVSNSLSALACAGILNIDKEVIAQSFLEFYGTHRRFENKGEINGVTIIDDYAHHPTEIKATLQAAKNYPHNKLWCIFQPHTYTRTIKLLDEFSTAFDGVDELILADIYAAREVDTGEISSKMLAEKIKKHGINAKYMSSFEDILEYVKGNASPQDIVITMGAGDVYKIGDMLFDN